VDQQAVRWLRQPVALQGGTTTMDLRLRIGATAVAGLVVIGMQMAPADAAAVSYRNCTAYHRTFPHGVGRNHAHDHTSGTPVTTFRHSTTLYKRAMAHNDDLDRDGDGIAFEKR
jgi:hypothetical protein